MTEQDSKNQSALMRICHYIFRLCVIAITTTVLGLIIAVVLQKQAKFDAMQRYLEEQEAKDEKPPPSEVIHVLNYHYVSPSDYANDLRSLNSNLTKEQIDKEYIKFLDDVEEVQKQQKKLLKELIEKHNLKSVYVEGLTERNYEGTMKFIETLKEYEKTKTAPESDFDRLVEAQNRIDLLELGAAGQLVVSGELETILPAEDSDAFEAANPVRSDGGVVFNWEANERRETNIVMNLLKDEDIVVVTLGGDHDLSDKLDRRSKSVKYKRVVVPKYKEIMED